MASLVSQALDAVRGRSVLLLGDLMLDAYVYGETERVSREAPVLVVRKEGEEHRLGGAANAAANFAALGARVSVLGMVGNDEAGQRISDLLSAAGVDVDGVQRGGISTPVKTRILAGAVGTTRQQVLRIDDEPRTAPEESFVGLLVQQLRRRAGAAGIVAVCDYGNGALTAPVIEAVTDVARAGNLVCVDSRRRLGAFAGVGWVKPNVPEAEQVVGFDLDTEEDVQRAGRAILERLGCRGCLLTLGRQGMALFDGDGRHSRVAIVGEEEVTDVTGAGDTVMAWFSAGLAAGIGAVNAMRLANCAAGIVVTKRGAATATPREILDAADRHGVELEPWDG